MKNLFFAIALILGINTFAQEIQGKAKVFVRIYDLQDKKISKGKILAITDSALQIEGNKDFINFDRIGVIRINHSSGHNILIGALSGAGLGTAIGAISANPDDWFFGFTAAEGATLGVFLGGGTGALIGWLSTLFKKSMTYIINGEQLKFKEFKETIFDSLH